MRRMSVVLLTGALMGGVVAAVPAAVAAPQSEAGPTVYVGQLSDDGLRQLRELGLDHEDIATGAVGSGTTAVEVILSPQEAATLNARGARLTEKRVGGQPVSRRMASQDASGYKVFRPYTSKDGVTGIADELRSVAEKYPTLAKLAVIGTSVQGKDILAIKVTKDAGTTKDGWRPSVLYSSAQHAREWITPEMNRRLLHHVLENYPTDPTIKRIVDTTELWFVPVANPDGYDHTFTQGNRLWRKNLRDNDGTGTVTAADGVDPNRNFGTHWGYDNEGSSPSTSSQTYRGPEPQSEPETRALDALMRRIGFEFQINYHSAAELLLYGTGWQVATPTPDDLLYETLAGDDAKPAVPGYDPDISAELYTTNGETTEHAQTRYGTLAFTPEMSTCATASASDPSDEFLPEKCESVFHFPDSEKLVQAEFTKNIPFALAVARSAKDPDDPVSVVRRRAPDFRVDSFDVSYGDPQAVAVTARRDLKDLTLNYSINGRRTIKAPAREWRGGERYGDEGDRYYGEFRGLVRGAKPGDTVKVWFTGDRPGKGRRTSASFTYRLSQDTENTVLVVANEDYEGFNPDYPATVTAPKYAREYVSALRSQGIKASVWDVSKQGVPHHLGALGHFKGVVWYLGDNRLTQDREDQLTRLEDPRLPKGHFADLAVAQRQYYLTMAVRDYLNEGGKLVHTGETAGYMGALGGLGGIFYGLDGDPEADCEVTKDVTSDCLLLADDFYQYYLGAYRRWTAQTPTGFEGSGDLSGTSGTFGGQATKDNPVNEAGHFGVTSQALPVERFPQFASRPAGAYVPPGGASGRFPAVSTEDSVLLGFGIEQLGSPAERAAVLGKAVKSLLEPSAGGGGGDRP